MNIKSSYKSGQEAKIYKNTAEKFTVGTLAMDATSDDAAHITYFEGQVKEDAKASLRQIQKPKGMLEKTAFTLGYVLAGDKRYRAKSIDGYLVNPLTPAYQPQNRACERVILN